MKSFQRILAILAILLLLGLYASTLIFAIMDRSAAKNMLMASIYCTVAVPVLLFAILTVAKVLKNTNTSANDGHNNEDSES